MKKLFLGTHGYTLAETWEEAQDNFDATGDEVLINLSLSYLKSMTNSLESQEL